MANVYTLGEIESYLLELESVIAKRDALPVYDLRRTSLQEIIDALVAFTQNHGWTRTGLNSYKPVVVGSDTPNVAPVELSYIHSADREPSKVSTPLTQWSTLPQIVLVKPELLAKATLTETTPPLPVPVSATVPSPDTTSTNPVESKLPGPKIIKTRGVL